MLTFCRVNESLATNISEISIGLVSMTKKHGFNQIQPNKLLSFVLCGAHGGLFQVNISKMNYKETFKLEPLNAAYIYSYTGSLSICATRDGTWTIDEKYWWPKFIGRDCIICSVLFPHNLWKQYFFESCDYMRWHTDATSQSWTGTHWIRLPPPPF